MLKPNFWKEKTLEQMTPEEWEALCDGCGRCCLYKLEDDEGFVYYTRIACRYLDLGRCQCTSYANRSEVMPTCVRLDVEKVHELGWLPPTCAYRLLALYQDLPPWHPLVSGDPNSVRQAGVSISEIAILETETNLNELEKYVIDWFDMDDH